MGPIKAGMALRGEEVSVFFAASIGWNSLLILGSADRCVYCHGLRQLTHYGSIFMAQQLTELGEKVTHVLKFQFLSKKCLI